jgi:two-component system, LytTR family, response regulator
MKAMIIEDSRLARQELKDLLINYPSITLCAEAENPRDALPIIHAERPELLFLDIHMPGKTGFDLLRELSYEPKVIFVTAFADQAIHSFEFNTLDYLLKPVSPARLQKCMEKIESDAANNQSDEINSVLDIKSQIMLRDGDICHWIKLEDIDYFESCTNHSYVFWCNNKSLVYRALGKIELRLPNSDFLRINRQQIINVKKITKVEPWINGGFQLTLSSGALVEVSRRHAATFRQLFSL